MRIPLAGAAASAAWVVTPGQGRKTARIDGDFAVLHGIYWLAANLAQQEPLLLAVDDGHWIDRASMRALA